MWESTGTHFTTVIFHQTRRRMKSRGWGSITLCSCLFPLNCFVHASDEIYSQMAQVEVCPCVVFYTFPTFSDRQFSSSLFPALHCSIHTIYTIYSYHQLFLILWELDIGALSSSHFTRNLLPAAVCSVVVSKEDKATICVAYHICSIDTFCVRLQTVTLVELNFKALILLPSLWQQQHDFA